MILDSSPSARPPKCCRSTSCESCGRSPLRKRFPYNRAPSGELLVPQSSLSGFLMGRQLPEGPPIYDHWFSKDHDTPAYELAKDIEQDARAYSQRHAKYGTVGQAVLVSEARRYAHTVMGRGQGAMFTGSRIKKLYSLGPDASPS